MIMLKLSKVTDYMFYHRWEVFKIRHVKETVEHHPNDSKNDLAMFHFSFVTSFMQTSLKEEDSSAEEKNCKSLSSLLIINQKSECWKDWW